jgi:hypothetical protein
MQNGDKWVCWGEDGSTHCKHPKDAPEGIVGPGQVDLGLEQDLGIGIGGGHSPLLDELNLAVEALGCLAEPGERLACGHQSVGLND